ncbi:MAG: hypothetical protein Q4A44_03125 [Bacteroidales bacterium]|nr:hypothetical protein [Bacteroidales bacterium]
MTKLYHPPTCKRFTIASTSLLHTSTLQRHDIVSTQPMLGRQCPDEILWGYPQDTLP